MQAAKRLRSPPLLPFALVQLLLSGDDALSVSLSPYLSTSLSPLADVFAGCQVYDFGDLNFTQVPNDELYNNLILYPRSVGLATQILADAVSRAVAAGHSCVTIGGDHR